MLLHCSLHTSYVDPCKIFQYERTWVTSAEEDIGSCGMSRVNPKVISTAKGLLFFLTAPTSKPKAIVNISRTFSAERIFGMRPPSQGNHAFAIPHHCAEIHQKACSIFTAKTALLNPLHRFKRWQLDALICECEPAKDTKAEKTRCSGCQGHSF